MIEATDYRNAMALLTGAVNVVTTAGLSGRHGFTASAVCSVTDTPPTLLVCMNKASRSHDHFIENQILTVNVLGADDQHISNVFSSKMSSEERFEYGNWTTLKTGAPVLDEALVSFDCQVEQTQEVGTHTIFICRVVAIQQSEHDREQNRGLVYFNRAYHYVGYQVEHKVNHHVGRAEAV
jgi:flavin reductase